jgi:4-hydroxy-tetrahydrodipicolinate synthase
MTELATRLRGLIPAVPVPFAGAAIHTAAQAAYARWMAGQPIAGVAIWAHTGRGRHLSADQRRTVLESWREALPDRVLVAGVHDLTTAIEARRGHADALLVYPERNDPVAHHARISRELPVILFHLYAAAGGVDYDDATLDALLDLPNVVGIKVATLDSVMTYQRIASIVGRHPDKLLITGEDRFLGYSVMLGAQSALIGMGAALTAMQSALLAAAREARWNDFVSLSARCDRFAQATFVEPMEGYIRRMLWALAADGVIPDDACDDPWGPPLLANQREAVASAVADARAADR